MACLFFGHQLTSQNSSRLDSLLEVLALAPEDTNKVRLLFKIYGEIAYNDPDQALAYVEQARDLSLQLNDRRGLVLSYDKIGGIYYNSSQISNALYYYRLADSLLQDMNWPREQAVIYGNYAGLYKEMAQYDSALWWNDRFLNIAREMDNRYFEGFGQIISGDIYHNKGQFNLAASQFLQALRIYEVLGEESRQADALMKLGETQTYGGSYEDARKNLEKAATIFQKLNDSYFLGQTYRDLGYLHFLQDDFERAEQFYQQSMALSRSVDDPYGLAQAEVQLGEIALQNGKPELALQQFNRALDLCLEIGDLYLEGDLYYHLATAFVQLKDFSQAQNMALRAEAVILEVGSPAQMKDLYSVYSRIYQGLEHPEAALGAFQKYYVIKDSLFTVEKTAQLEELQLIYSVEKKNQAIELLSKDVELHRVKQQRLIGSLVALALIAGLIIYLQFIRRQRDRRIAEEARRRRMLELEKSQLEKQQLERELTAQVLQLCRKNEMLISVQEEIKGLAKQPSENHQPSLRRLQRSIQSDIQSDDDWRQFLSTFENVHPDFLNHLLSQADRLSAAEQRLACLLKMNLSSKEIATLLNISDEGVKKGRYRLRKKLGLPKGTNLQEYLINLQILERVAG